MSEDYMRDAMERSLMHRDADRLAADVRHHDVMTALTRISVALERLVAALERERC